jgi:hypothetical protein
MRVPGGGTEFDYSRRSMDLWQGVSVDSLKFHPGPSCPTLLRSADARPAAVFFPFGHSTPYMPMRRRFVVGEGEEGEVEGRGGKGRVLGDGEREEEEENIFVCKLYQCRVRRRFGKIIGC